MHAIENINIFAMCLRDKHNNINKNNLKTFRIMKTNDIITENGYTVEQSISGYWRLMKDGEVIYDDSACEDLNEDKETARAFFNEYLKNN